MNRVIASALWICIQFVIITNFAHAYDYVPSDQALPKSDIHPSEAAFSFVDILTLLSMDGQDLGVDLCLPAVLPTEYVFESVTSRNTHSSFEAVAFQWIPPRRLRPPIFSFS